MRLLRLSRHAIAIYTVGVLICGSLVGFEIALVVLSSNGEPHQSVEGGPQGEGTSGQPEDGFWTIDFGDLALIVFNGLLVISTAGLWFHTARLARGADRQIGVAEKAAAAAIENAKMAKLSVEAFAAKERAFIVPVEMRGGIASPSTGATTTNAWCQTNWLNIGLTSARVYEMRMKVVLGPNLPPPPDLSKAPTTISYGQTVIVSDAQIRGNESNTIKIPIAHLQAIRSGAQTLFATGSITYKTVFDTTFTRVFAKKWKHLEGEWAPAGGDAHNFECEGYYQNPNEPSDALHVNSAVTIRATVSGIYRREP